ncbi:hypothetical protein QZH41_015812, partial [Actinostola sp. cb2023]
RYGPWCQLKHIFTLDPNLPEFSITNVSVIDRPVHTLHPGCQEWQNNHQEPSSEFKVTVQFVSSCYGNFYQRFVFDFGAIPKIVRYLGVMVAPETSLVKQLSHQRPSTEENELNWLNRYELLSYDGELQNGPAQSCYQVPASMKQGVDFGSFDFLDDELTTEYYKDRLHTLLYLEEYERRKQLTRLNLNCEDLLRCTTVSVEHMGRLSIELPINPDVLEDANHLINRSSRAIVKLVPSGKREPKLYEVIVGALKKDSIILLTSEVLQDTLQRAKPPLPASVCFRFVDTYKFMHRAIDNINLDCVFPSNPTGLSLEWDVGTHAFLNKTQATALSHILDPRPKPPLLIFGPFGTGKTRTIAEAVKELCRLHSGNPEEDLRILICTHSNSAADHYIVDHLHPFVVSSELGCNLCTPLRICWENRFLKTVSSSVLKYCFISEETGKFAVPSKNVLDKYRVIVTTLVTADVLTGLGLPDGYFSHVFIDEAAQAMEAETLIPLCLSTPSTRVVLAGDHLQLGAIVDSPIARRLALDRSLLVRLYDYYPRTSNCKLLLLENYRAYEDIVDIPSKLFYEGTLVAHKTRPPLLEYPVHFYGVLGKEARAPDIPSYYNMAEAAEISERVEELVDKWTEDSDEDVAMENICVLSPYTAQVREIRQLLRKKKLGQVRVESVNNVQGLEFDAIFISTVHTSYAMTADTLDRQDLGFLSDPRLLNTAVTRAKYHLVVVGDPSALCGAGDCKVCWKTILSKCNENGTFHYRLPFDKVIEYTRSNLPNHQERTLPKEVADNILKQLQFVTNEKQGASHRLSAHEVIARQLGIDCTDASTAAANWSNPFNSRQMASHIPSVSSESDEEVQQLLQPPFPSDDGPESAQNDDLGDSDTEEWFQARREDPLVQEYIKAFESLAETFFRERDEDQAQSYQGDSSDDFHAGREVLESSKWLLEPSTSSFYIGNAIHQEYEDEGIVFTNLLSNEFVLCTLEINSASGSIARVLANDVKAMLMGSNLSEMNPDVMFYNDITISSRVDMNRAFHGDIVAVEIIDTASPRPRGRVVFIFKEVHSRECICTVDVQDTNVMIPIDKINPHMIVMQSKDHRGEIGVAVFTFRDGEAKCREFVSDTIGCLFLVRVLQWGANYRLPLGIVRKCFKEVNDLNSAMSVFAAEHGIRLNQPDDVVNETGNIFPDDFQVPETEWLSRAYRYNNVFTLDCGASLGMELDDAISIVIEKGGTYLVGVHVSDVSYYVRKGSCIDKAAFVQGSSVYPEQHNGSAINMLPPQLILTWNKHDVQCSVPTSSRPPHSATSTPQETQPGAHDVSYFVNVQANNWFSFLQEVIRGSMKRIVKQWKKVNSNSLVVHRNPSLPDTEESTATESTDGCVARLATGAQVDIVLGSEMRRGLLQPVIRGLQVSSSLFSCISHRHSPESIYCLFLTRPTLPSYRDVQHYQRIMLPLIEAESASSVLRSYKTSVRLHGVSLSWTGYGKSACANLMLPKAILDSQDLKFSVGDYLCIRSEASSQTQRTDNQTSSNTCILLHARVTQLTVNSDRVVFFIEVTEPSDIISAETLQRHAHKYTIEVIPQSPRYKYMLEAVRALGQSPEILRSVVLCHDLPCTPAKLDVSVLRYFPLDIDQAGAVKSALNSPFTVIHGQPGTGKTWTAVAITCHYINNNWQARGGQVLLCAPNNTALDVIAKMLVKIPSVNVLRVYSREDEYSDVQQCQPTVVIDDCKPLALHLRVRRPENPHSNALRMCLLEIDQLKVRIAQSETAERENLQKKLMSKKQKLNAILDAAEGHEFTQTSIHVILCTCAEAGSPRVRKFTQVSQCIVDECNMCLDAELLVPLVLAGQRCDHMVLIGDPKQLVPVLHSKTAVKYGLGRSLFENLIEDHVGKKYECRLLRMQFRMHPSLRVFSSEYFYTGKPVFDALQVTESTVRMEGFWPNSQEEYRLFCHVTGEEHVFADLTGDLEADRCNPTEIEKIVAVVDHIKSFGFKPEHVCIISPYMTQRRRIQDVLNERDMPIMSPQESQGSEHPFVIFSTVRSTTQVHPGKIGCLGDGHQMNVVFTRARLGLIIIG